MESFVDLEEAVAVLNGRFQRRLLRLQRGELFVAGALRHHAGGVALQQGQQVVDVAQVLFADLGDVGTSAHFHGHQTFGGQHLERLAQRGAADAQGLGDAHLVDPAAGLELARKNALAQQLGHLFVEGAGGK